jgi:hypothetical protein
LVGDGLPEAVKLLFGQGYGNRFASHFAGPDISAALLRGFAFKDATLRKEAQAGQSLS